MKDLRYGETPRDSDRRFTAVDMKKRLKTIEDNQAISYKRAADAMEEQAINKRLSADFELCFGDD